MATPYTYLSPVLYKKYFEIQLYHPSLPDGTCQAFDLKPTAACQRYLDDNKMGYKTEPGKILIYISGTEVAGLTSPPDKAMLPFSAFPAPDGTEFTFIITYRNKDIVGFDRLMHPLINIPGNINLRTYSPPGNNYGSPPAYDDQPTPIPWTFIKPAMVSLQFLPASFGSMETLNVSRLIFSPISGSVVAVLITSLTIYKNDQFGNFNCYVDMSLQASGCYLFQIASDGPGTYAKQYYVDTIGETVGCYGIYRLIKQLASPPDPLNWAESPPLIASPPIIDVALQAHHVFTYTFPAPP